MGNTPVKISALAIVYNEKDNIREYLQNMDFADEIVVVDSFSTDGTVEIIQQEFPHVRLYQRVFDDFSSQRNFTIDLAENDWVAFFDADERVTDKGITEMVNYINTNPEEVALWVKRIFYYKDEPLVNNNFNEDRTARIFRRSKCRYSDKLVHEQLTINGKSKVLKYAIKHFSFKNREDFLQKRLQYSKLKAKELYLEGVKTNIFHFTVRPGFRFFKYYILKLGFTNGRRGYDIARILGYHVYMRYVYLRQMNKIPRKILVIQQKMIGDVLAGSIICDVLKQSFPLSQVEYMVYGFTLPVVENNPNIDKLVIFDEATRKSRWKLIKFSFGIRQEKYDAVIDVYNKWESGIITLLSKAKIRIGLKKWYTAFFYDKTIDVDWRVQDSALVHRIQLAEALTGIKHPVAFPGIYLSEDQVQYAMDKLAARQDKTLPLVMVSALGSDAIKSLPAAEMAAVLDLIVQNCNAELILNYMPRQEEAAQKIYNACKPQTQQRIRRDLYTSDLREFLPILAQCTALIGNEGGAVNMAKALGVPTFTIFSPWINKSSWNMLADGNKHVAVHLQDYYPEIYNNQHPKEFKGKALELYEKLKPELFSGALLKFLEQNIK
jgi:heptosyltransferase II